MPLVMDILDVLSNFSGAYIFSLPFLIVVYAYQYEDKRDEKILKLLQAIATITLIWWSFLFQDGTTIYLSIIAWISILIPLSLVILFFIRKNSSSRKLNFKKLEIFEIPKKIIIIKLAILIIAFSIIIGDTRMNRSTVLESYNSFIEEVSESDNPHKVLMANALNPYSLLLGIIDDAELIKNGEITSFVSSPWKIKVSALTEAPSERIIWEFTYIRYYGEWKLDGSYTTKTISRRR